MPQLWHSLAYYLIDNCHYIFFEAPQALDFL